jgi:hypothetical protein
VATEPLRVRRVCFCAFALILALLMAWGVHGLVAKSGLNTANPASWLPKQQLDHHVDQTIAGSVAHPGLTVNGGDVQVKTPTFSVLAVVNGPVVPGEGLPVVQNYTTCTWTISLDHVRGTVPVSVADFDSIDYQQTVFKLTLVPGQPPLPTALHSGQSLSFEVRAVMPTGEGLMRWAPDGNNIVAKWDYQVEND